MTLPADTCRCLGEKPTGTCEQRTRCQRYTERDNYGPSTPFATWMCGPYDNDHIIRHAQTQQVPAQAAHH